MYVPIIRNTPECNLLVSLEVQDKINKINQTNVHDKNNNDKLNTIKQSNSKSDIETTTLLIKGNQNNLFLYKNFYYDFNSKNKCNINILFYIYFIR